MHARRFSRLHHSPLPLKDVEMYAKIVSKCRDGQRFMHTKDGLEELSEDEYTEMLVEHWKDMDRDMVYDMMDHMTKK